MTPRLSIARRRLSRRVFLTDLGRGGAAAIVVGTGLVACSDDNEAPAATAPPETASSGTAAATAPPTEAAGAATPTATSAASEGASSNEGTASGVEWQRVSLGFVSAYVLVRGGEAAVVDTGVEGSESDIEAGLSSLGAAWSDVGHVIVTHSHGDHMGSLAGVMELSPDATAYGGAADIPAMTSPRPIVAVADGDRVFDLEIIETPGHTLGHIAVLDAAGGLLVAGDALNAQNGTLAGSNPQFTADVELANASVAKLGALTFDTAVFGHGDPIEGGASEQVAALTARL